MEEGHDSDGGVFLELTINNIMYHYDGHQLTCFGYKMSTEIDFGHPTHDEPIEFWRSQLAFRGFSSRGRDTNALKERLVNADTDEMSVAVAEGLVEMIDVYRRGERERLTQQGRQQAQRTIQVELQRQDDARKQALQEKWANRIIDKRLAEDEPRTFLFELFCDQDGEDEGGPPIELEDLILADRANLHEAAGILGLFHKTSISNVMVMGSGKNDLAARKLHELNRPGGLARPRIPLSQDEIDRLAGIQDGLGFIPQVERRRVGLDHMSGAEIKHYLNIHSSRSIPEGDQDIDGEKEPGKEDEDAEKNDNSDENDDGPWSITGHWELKCEAMLGDCNHSEPYTLNIFSATPIRGLEICGRFNLGDFKGVIRVARGGHSTDRNEYQLNREFGPSTPSPTIKYRWRGKDFKDTIQIGSDSYLYTMTFSGGGRTVEGIWGKHDGPPGHVTFTGVKVAEEDRPAGLEILQEWRNYSQRAYDNTNRDRRT